MDGETEPAVPPALSVVGPTASGKSALALALARRRISSGRPVELLSIDSMAVYRGMDIGTASPTADERAAVPHHLVDLVDPDHEFSVAEFRDAADLAMAGIRSRGAAAILVGGTGLYHQAIVDALDLPGRFPEVADHLREETDTGVLYRRLLELDPLAATRVEPDNRRRIVRALEVTIGSGRAFSSYGPGLDAHPPTPYVLVGLRVERPELHARIEARFMAQMDAGLLDEVRALASRPEGISRTAAQALGYRELLEHLQGRCSLDAAVALAVRRTRQFAVRQIRWFRRDPRITWFDSDADLDRLATDVDHFWSGRS
jgi:tRNA dimethylallyltransferase